MLRILHCHKKYENDKYFGGSIFKRGINNQITNSAINGGTGQGVNGSTNN